MSEMNEQQLREGAAYADRWIEYQRYRHEIPGVVVTVRRGGDLLLSSAHGWANLTDEVPLTTSHIFRVASHSKTFTATAIMQLSEGAKLRLDDPIRTYVPWLAGVEGLGDVTIRQALNHAAGFVRDGDRADYWQLDYPFPDEGELRRMVQEGGRVYAANEKFKYSNIGYSLLGVVIQAASGLPYGEYVQRHIIDPLQLDNTGPETDPAIRELLVTGYSRRELGLTALPLPDATTGAMAPATGFYSTAEDLSRYAVAQCIGSGELLSDASKREMQQPYWRVDRGEEQFYGLGFAITTVGERLLIGHGGGFPGHATRTLFDPEDRLAVVVLTNQTNAPAGSLAGTVFKIIDFALSQPRASNAHSVGDRERFLGRFIDGGGVTDIVRFGDSLLALTPEADDPVKQVTELEVVGHDTLRMVKTNGYGAPGETIQYRWDRTGNAVQVIAGGVSSYPLEIYRQRLARFRSA